MFHRLMQKAHVRGLDLRSIGLFRIAIGLTLLLDVLIFKLPNIGDLYSPAGFFEDFYRTQALDARPFYLNLFYYLGSGPGIYLFFIGCGVVYLGLAVGYRPRLLVVISFLLSSMTAASNSLMTLGPDVLLLTALFWGMFLPIDARFCFRSRTRIREGNECRNLPAFLLLATSYLLFRSGLIICRPSKHIKPLGPRLVPIVRFSRLCFCYFVFALW